MNSQILQDTLNNTRLKLVYLGVMMPEPFTRWLGGKRNLVPTLINLAPKTSKRYFEPFVGAGAMFWGFDHADNVICDSNDQLINAYVCIRDHHLELKDAIALEWSAMQTDPYSQYYSLRSQFNENIACFGVAQAARFLVLMHSCFNGVYRVNRKGAYNVPYALNIIESIEKGLKFPYQKIEKCHQYLTQREVDIRFGSYAHGCEGAIAGDLIYCDPPYAKVNSTSFTAYTHADFTLEDQIDLAQFLKRKVDAGCSVIASNSAHPDIRTLYLDLGFTIHDVQMRRNVNRDADGRSPVPEIVATSF